MSPLPDPASVPARTDLPFLRHRTRPRPAVAAPPGSPVGDYFAGRSTHRPPPAAAAPAAAPVSRPISFDRPGRTHAASPPASGSLDLSEPTVPTSSPQRTPVAPQARPPAGPRVRAGEQHLLSVTAPTAVLTRVQSGIGTLSIEAACSPDVGDLRLGAAYQLASGPTSTVQLADGGNRFAPSSRRPVIVAGRDEFDHLRVDLRQIRQLERAVVYAFSESRSELSWGGTLLITTPGNTRLELPLENLYRGKIAVVVSLYVVDGVLVVRAEMETITGDVREAARAYGYDRITWRDDRTPID